MRRFAVVASLVSVLLVGIPAVAAAAPGDPVGERMTLRISPGGQKALVAGVPVAAGAVVCTFSGGTACAAASVLGAIMAPLLEEATVCPDDGVRKIEVQTYEAFSVRIDDESNPYGANLHGDRAVHLEHRILSDTCVPA
jgi:hypothetical protein